jgi:hypothetical protein
MTASLSLIAVRRRTAATAGGGERERRTIVVIHGFKDYTDCTDETSAAPPDVTL